MQYDLKAALNAISDVIQNRPLPLREFDQIYMKVGDMVEQAFFIADKFKNLDVVFIGDGDSIALSVIHFWKCNVFPNAPRRIHVLDFDERIVKAITRFADKYCYQELMEIASRFVRTEGNLEHAVHRVYGQHVPLDGLKTQTINKPKNGRFQNLDSTPYSECDRSEVGFRSKGSNAALVACKDHDLRIVDGFRQEDGLARVYR